MAKHKAKTSKSQRDRSNILIAKKLKAAGIISKRANLHSGKYISKGVLQKVRQYQSAAEFNYKAIKVSKAMARDAKAKGFQVVGGNKIIGPNSKRFTTRLKKGELTGVRPVKGGMMEEVILPMSVTDMQSLHNLLASGIDNLKMSDEQFAFRYHGNESYRAFLNTQQLLDYMRHYKGLTDLSASRKPEDLQEEFEGFSIFRLHESAVPKNLRTVRQREEDRKLMRREAMRSGVWVGKPNRKSKTRSERAANMHPDRAARFLQGLADKDKARRTKIMSDPFKAAQYKEAAKKRAKLSREKKG
jgi:hypothetical protein